MTEKLSAKKERMEMEELNLLEKVNRVKAPPDFEQKVLSLLSRRRETRRQRMRYFRYSFASAAAVVLVFIIVLNVFILPKKSPVQYSGVERAVSSSISEAGVRAEDYIPIIETVNYSQEIRRRESDSNVIYILENVSLASRDKIKF